MSAAEKTFPSEAVSALEQGSKIEAIKIVRERFGIGLKEAKEEVERHLHKNPTLKQQMDSRRIEVGKSPGALLFFVIVAALVAFLVFRW